MGRIRRAVLGYIREFGHPEDSYIFTNVLSEDEERSFRTIERLAKRRKALFVPVWLKCGVRELRKRKATPQRVRMMKEIDLSTIPYWTKEFHELEVEHPNAVAIDNTNIRATQTAKLILDHIERLGER